MSAADKGRVASFASLACVPTAPAPSCSHNSNSAPASLPLRVPVRLGPGAASWAVLASDGKTPVPAQLVPASPADTALRTTYYGVPASNMSWLAFIPPPVAAVGYALVFLVPVAAQADAPSTAPSVVSPVPLGAAAELTLGNVTLGFDASGLLANYSDAGAGGLATQLRHNFLYYASSRGDTEDKQASLRGGVRRECE